MSSRELERVEVMGRVASGDLKLTSAAIMLELSYRQAKRLWRRYRQVGSQGLKHGNAGRPSNRSKPAKFRRRVLNLIQKKYSGSEEERFGPTLAAEHLAAEDGIVMDHDSLRRWMLEEGLWSRKRKRQRHCQRRERKSHFGELVQLDGSFHDWLEGRGPGGCLMDMVDDATSMTGPFGQRRDHLGGSGSVAGVDWEVWSAALSLYRLEERVQAKGDPSRAVAGRSCGDAVWAHVSEAGDSHHCRQFAAGEGTGGAQPRDPSGSADQEITAERDRQLRSREPISGKRISAAAQPTFRAAGGKAGGLSRAEVESTRTPSDFSVGD